MNTGIARDGERKTSVRSRRELYDGEILISGLSLLSPAVLSRDPQRNCPQKFTALFGPNVSPSFSRTVYIDGFCDPSTF